MYCCERAKKGGLVLTVFVFPAYCKSVMTDEEKYTRGTPLAPRSCERGGCLLLLRVALLHVILHSRKICVVICIILLLRYYNTFVLFELPLLIV